MDNLLGHLRKVWACLLGSCLLGAFFVGAAHAETRVYAIFDEALEPEASHFRAAITRDADFVFAPDRDLEVMMAACRDELGVGLEQERECQLKAARRVMVDRVFELSSRKLKRSWELTLSVYDSDGSTIHEQLQVADRDEDLSDAARRLLPQLARSYLCEVEHQARACDEPRLALSGGGRLELIALQPAVLSVWINGVEVGTTPAQFLDLPEGVVSLTLRAPGYQDWSQDIELSADKLLSLRDIALQPLPAKLGLKCNIEEATIELDAQPVALTRAREWVELELSPGAHELTVRREGYVPASQTLYLLPGEALRLELELSVELGPPEGFVRIPKGSFELPSDDQLGAPRQLGIAAPLFVQSTEVTQSLWLELMGQSPSHFAQCGQLCPVESVSWWDALAFANAMSEREQLQQCYALEDCVGVAGSGDFSCSAVHLVEPVCDGYRLPTESEWEYAARSGGEHPAEGDEDDDDAWHDLNAASKTHPVAQKSPNPWGLYDMQGNVWEWVWDRFVRDEPAESWRSSDTWRVIRGGAWLSGVRLREGLSARHGVEPESLGSHIGLRLVRSAW